MESIEKGKINQRKHDQIMSKKNKKLCFAASSGGHFEQIMMLGPLMEKYDSFIVTEKTDYKTALTKEKIYYLHQVNRREKLFIFEIIWNTILSIGIYIKECPDVVICTGVLATIPICMLAKLFKKKLIYIESFAKITGPTKTGKLIYQFADKFYVQWESMLKVFPNATYIGGIY